MNLYTSAAVRTERAEKLRQLLLATVPKVSSERIRYYTQSFQQHEPEPVILKRARAFSIMLAKMNLYILDEELIVGNTCQYPRGVEVFPEYEIRWLEQELKGDPYPLDERPGDRFLIDGETKKEIFDLLPYWKGKTFCERVLSMLPEDVQKAWKIGAVDSYWLMQGGDGHITLNFKHLLKNGVKGILQALTEAEGQLDLSEPESVKKMLFYKASRIVLTAFITYANRYAYLAQSLSLTQSGKRKKELEKIAAICRKVPEHPADSFQEALQAVWFLQAAEQIESNGHGVSMGRLDQTLYPYFQHDIESGAVSFDEAAELLQCFWLKLFTANKIKDWNSTQFFAGYQAYQNLTVGGQTENGEDAANDLSFLMLGVQKAIGLWVPSISFRYHDGISEEFLQAAIDVTKGGGGQPAFYSDECMIPSLLMRGVPLEEARNWSVVGCVEPTVEGRQTNRPNGAAFISILKILEIVLYGGKDPNTGIQIYKGKDITQMASYDELYAAWKKCAMEMVRIQMIWDNIIDAVREEQSPDPFASCFVDDCIKRGKTIKEGGAVYDFCGPLICGLANVGDSLAAIKELVFEKESFSPGELLHALETNFEDEATDPSGPEIQARLLAAPKYGNDDDYVDTITTEVLDLFCKELPQYKTTRYGRGPKGGMWLASCSTVSGNIPFGKPIGATPDGRKAGTPTADTTSPTQGMDRSGPLHTMKSVGKIPNILCTGGNLFNMKFSPLVLQDDTGRRKFSHLIRTFLGDLKGMHVQFNVVDREILEDAKANPDQYPDLMVRVAGFSALFTSLDPKLQDDIINRTEQAMEI